MEKKENEVTPSSPSNVRKSSRGVQLCENLSYAAKEAFKRLRENVLLALPKETDGCAIIGVTSAQPAEGKSTISINTAFSFAELGKKVLVIDADLRRPSLHEKIGVSQTPGLSNLLSDSNSIGAAIKTYKSKTSDTSFDIITSGGIISNPSEVLTSDRMGKLLRALSSAYDYIFLDLPPVGVVIDAVSVGRYAEGMIVVIRENHCSAPVFDDCIEQLRYAGIRILGFVVNGAVEGAGKKYQYQSYRYY